MQFVVQPEQQAQSSAFVRDRFTWFAYLILGYYTFLQAMLGPLATIFQTRFHLSYSATSLPTSAYAIGIILVGVGGTSVTRRFNVNGARWVWFGGAGMALGVVSLILSPNFMLVIFSSFIMGVFAALLQFVLQALLANHHPERRATTLTEANVVTSVGAGLAPLVISGALWSGLGWQTALIVSLSLIVVSVIPFRRINTPPLFVKTVDAVPTSIRPHLTLAFWLYWLVLVCSVAMEWSIIVWSALFLHAVGAVSISLAALLLGLFFVAEALGRFLGSRLTQHIAVTSMLLITLSVAGCGFMLFWLAPLPPVKITGLFLTGLGIANLFPLTLAAAMSSVPQIASIASARLSLGIGLAMLGAPIILGHVADAIGIQHAYGIVLGLLALAGAVTLIAPRCDHLVYNLKSHSGFLHLHQWPVPVGNFPED